MTAAAAATDATTCCPIASNVIWDMNNVVCTHAHSDTVTTQFYGI